MITRRFAATSARVLCMTAIWPCASAAEMLSAGDMTALVTGATVEFTSRRGNPGAMTFAPGGRFSGTVTIPPGPISDRGKWWVEKDGLLCFRYENWQGGADRCLYLERTRDGFRRYGPDRAALMGRNWVIRK